MQGNQGSVESIRICKCISYLCSKFEVNCLWSWSNTSQSCRSSKIIYQRCCFDKASQAARLITRLRLITSFHLDSCAWNCRLTAWLYHHYEKLRGPSWTCQPDWTHLLPCHCYLRSPSLARPHTTYLLVSIFRILTAHSSHTRSFQENY